MPSSKDLCKKISTIYPEIGKCGSDVDVYYDYGQDAWVVKLSREGKKLHTFLDYDETNACLEGVRCVSLGTQIAQLLDNIGRF